MAYPPEIELFAEITHKEAKAKIARQASRQEFEEHKKVFPRAAFLRAEENTHERETIREAKRPHRKSCQ